MLDKLESALARANYRRQTRRINSNDVIEVIRDAHETGYGYCTGGSVPNAYKYPATAACVAAVCLDSDHNTVLVRFGSCNAQKTASPVSWFGPQSKRENAVLDWLKDQTHEGLVSKGWIVLLPQEVEEVTR